MLTAVVALIFAAVALFAVRIIIKLFAFVLLCLLTAAVYGVPVASFFPHFTH